jgi:hypothetical protein
MQTPFETPSRNPRSDRKPEPAETPLPRSRKTPADSDAFLKNPKLRNSILDQQQGFHRGPFGRRKGFVLVAFSWTAATMDSLLILGTSMIFFASFLFVTGVSTQMILVGDKNLIYQLGFSSLLVFSFIYMVMLRSVLGYTVGEWACSLRMGLPLQRLSSFYPFRIAARTLLVFSTGIVTLPLLGLLIGRDLAGRICGVQLTSLK